MAGADINAAGHSGGAADHPPSIQPDPLYPDADRPPRLAAELCTFLAAQPAVRRIIMFGSQARGTWDRWSDLDLLLVTAGEEDYRGVLTALCAYKPIIYHAPVRSSADHPGRHVIGIVFEDESVFHTLDLNFMPVAVYGQAGARAWFDTFGPAIDYYVAQESEEPIATPASSAVDPDPDPQEQALEAANWWLKRTLRRVLRTGQGHDELTRHVQAVQTAMLGLPTSCAMPGGDPCHLAHIYLVFADRLLSSGQ